jgi:hypothetical protein
MRARSPCAAPGPPLIPLDACHQTRTDLTGLPPEAGPKRGRFEGQGGGGLAPGADNLAGVGGQNV